jgi:hypothetical protein
VTDLAVLDRAHLAIMRRFIETGRAPHYVELARDLGLGVEDGRQVLLDLMESGVPAWVHPQTDYIVSVAPFNNLPTQYRVTIDGHQKWFAQ